MKHFLWILVAAVFLSFVIDVSSDDYDRNAEVQINVNKRNPDGSYFYEYLLDNGASQKVTGTLKDVNGEKVYSVEGSYSYDQEDGDTLTVKYIADENGFRVLPVEKTTGPQLVQEVSLPGNYAINPKAIASILGR